MISLLNGLTIEPLSKLKGTKKVNAFLNDDVVLVLNDEQEQLGVEDKFSLSRTESNLRQVRFFRLPDSLLEYLETTPFGRSFQLSDLISSEEFFEILTVLDPLVISGEGLSFYGVVKVPCGVSSVTRKWSGGPLAGLHTERWGMSMENISSQQVGNIAVNISREVRRFLFLNLEISQVRELMGVRTNCEENSLIRLFFQKYPDYPILSVELESGEGVIYPCDTCFHDWDTSSATEVGRSLLFTAHAYE